MYKMQARLATLLKTLKDRIPRQQLHSCYQKTISRLHASFNLTTQKSARLVTDLQRWTSSHWPPLRHTLLSYAGRIRQFVIDTGLRTVQLTSMLIKSFGMALQKATRQVLALIRRLVLQLQRWIGIYWPPVRARLLLYIELTRLNRPIGILLLLWPTLWAIWIAAEGVPTLHLFLVFTLGVILTRSAGCVFNDMADRNIDGQVRRTVQRPLATGRMGVREALLVAVVLLLFAFLLVLTTNRFTVLLSLVAIPLAVIYPFMKRYTYVPQFFLGLAFSWGIPMAFAATTESIPNIAWLLFIANILWTVIYDTIYAMVDREDDRRIGVKSTAILFDDADRFIIGLLQLMFLAVLVIIGIQIKAKMLYYVALIPVAALLVYHQYLIRDRAPESCFRAFLHNNWVGLIIFAGVCLNYL